MKKKLRRWLASVSSAFPTTFSPYWRVLPLGRMKMFLAGYFFVGAAGGFTCDLLQLNVSRVGGGFFWPVLVGTGATALRAAAIKRVRLIPLLLLLFVVTGWLGYWAAHVSTPLPVPVAVHRRVLFDAIGILVGIGLGARLLMFFAGTEGVAMCVCRQSFLWPTVFRRPWFRPSLSRTRASSYTANRSLAQKWAAT
jgi:hypothetical protein